MNRNLLLTLRELSDKINKHYLYNAEHEILCLTDLSQYLDQIRMDSSYTSFSAPQLAALLEDLLLETSSKLQLVNIAGEWYCMPSSLLLEAHPITLVPPYEQEQEEKIVLPRKRESTEPQTFNMLKKVAEKLLGSKTIEVWQDANGRPFSTHGVGATIRYVSTEVETYVSAKRDYWTLEDVQEYYGCTNQKLKDSIQRAGTTLPEAARLIGYRGRVYYIPEVLKFQEKVKQFLRPVKKVYVSTTLNPSIDEGTLWTPSLGTDKLEAIEDVKGPNNTDEIAIKHVSKAKAEEGEAAAKTHGAKYDTPVRVPHTTTNDYSLNLSQAARKLGCPRLVLVEFLKADKTKDVFTRYKTKGSGSLRLSVTEVESYVGLYAEYLTTRKAEAALLVPVDYLKTKRTTSGSPQDYIRAERFINGLSQVYSFDTLMRFSIRNGFNTAYLESVGDYRGLELDRDDFPGSDSKLNLDKSTPLDQDQSRERPSSMSFFKL